MLQKDKVKSIAGLSLVVLLVTTLMIVGKESIVMKYVSAFCLLAWITVMLIVNKKYK